jgi:hypothetical protein
MGMRIPTLPVIGELSTTPTRLCSVRETENFIQRISLWVCRMKCLCPVSRIPCSYSRNQGSYLGQASDYTHRGFLCTFSSPSLQMFAESLKLRDECFFPFPSSISLFTIPTIQRYVVWAKQINKGMKTYKAIWQHLWNEFWKIIMGIVLLRTCDSRVSGKRVSSGVRNNMERTYWVTLLVFKVSGTFFNILNLGTL